MTLCTRMHLNHLSRRRSKVFSRSQKNETQTEDHPKDQGNTAPIGNIGAKDKGDESEKKDVESIEDKVVEVDKGKGVADQTIVTRPVTGTLPQIPINLDGSVNLGKMSPTEKLILYKSRLVKICGWRSGGIPVVGRWLAGKRGRWGGGPEVSGDREAGCSSSGDGAQAKGPQAAGGRGLGAVSTGAAEAAGGVAAEGRGGRRPGRFGLVAGARSR
ncbi:uncharacterized protein LOC131876657 [Cryptomeria japonica]|uniref:uncharacterized protein LOC131876657 n=1 Tax=Cryptomeria japonica TaxID=3369 RepID=UPI0027DA62CF|nr:uncharacterized protein LOC131876657 [Cryptomeria japonica]